MMSKRYDKIRHYNVKTTNDNSHHIIIFKMILNDVGTNAFRMNLFWIDPAWLFANLRHFFPPAIKFNIISFFYHWLVSIIKMGSFLFSVFVKLSLAIRIIICHRYPIQNFVSTFFNFPICNRIFILHWIDVDDDWWF